MSHIQLFTERIESVPLFWSRKSVIRELPAVLKDRGHDFFLYVRISGPHSAS